MANYMVTDSSTGQVWLAWTATGTTATSSTAVVWDYWCNGTAGTSPGKTNTTGTVWLRWTTCTASNTAPVEVATARHARPLSAEEAERRAAEADRRQAEIGRRLVEEEKRRKAAERRAKKLLLQCLNLEQKLSYVRTQKFRVEAPSGRVYELRRGWAGNVEELGADGKPVNMLCIHPGVRVPEEDNLLAQKLMIETDEEAFRRTANFTRLREAAGARN